MSVLDRENDGQFNLIGVLFRCLREGKTARNRLLDLCAPPSAVPDRKRITASLNTATELGLFVREGDDYSLAPGSAGGELGDTFRRLVLSADNNPDLWARVRSRAADFTRAACWMLAQDVVSLHDSSWDDITALEEKQLGGRPIFSNNSVLWDGFRPLARYLGFGWGDPFRADPTVAIEAALPTLFGPAPKQMHQKEFLRLLADALPMLDGGTYRLGVERRLGEVGEWRGPAVGHLSRSLSLALKRLGMSGQVVLATKDDDPDGIASLSGHGDRTIGGFTHITYKGGR